VSFWNGVTALKLGDRARRAAAIDPGPIPNGRQADDVQSQSAVIQKIAANFIGWKPYGQQQNSRQPRPR
jgi:hypothetical protein